MTTGTRYRSDSSDAGEPHAEAEREHPRADLGRGVAPTAPAAWKTMTAELAKPTSTVTKPATTADRDRSRTRT